MNDNFDNLNKELSTLVEALTMNSQGLWGSMTHIQMLRHLTAGLQMGVSYKAYEITTPEDKIDSYQRFLMSDRGFAQGAPKPKEYLPFEEGEPQALDEEKRRFLEAFEVFKNETESQPDFWMNHPSFGKLDAIMARQLMYKHIKHHFTQFGIME